MSPRLRVLVNPNAGRGRGLAPLASVRAELRRLGAEHVVVSTQSLAHAREEARAAAEREETVVAVGGDGFCGALAAELAGTPSALAFVPSGRGNDFARKLGVPKETVAAARLAVQGTVRSVDMGVANGTPFLGIASVGVDSDTQRYVESMRLVQGELVYFLAAVRAVARWRSARFTVTVDGRRSELSGYSVSVANSGIYGGGMRLVPHAEIDDGRLDAITIADYSKLRFFALFLTVFRGGHVNASPISFQSGVEVVVSADRPFVVYADGEPITDLPVTVRVLPATLRVVAPATGGGVP